MKSGNNKDGKARGKRSGRRPDGRRKRFTAGFLVAVLIVMALFAFFVQAMQQLTARSDIKVRSVEKSIAGEKVKQKQLRLELARLKSPGRVARIAQDELTMGEPTGVIYMKYSTDAGGNPSCESTFEEREPAAPPQRPAAAEEPRDGTLTRR